MSCNCNFVLPNLTVTQWARYLVNSEYVSITTNIIIICNNEYEYVCMYRHSVVTLSIGFLYEWIIAIHSLLNQFPNRVAVPVTDFRFLHVMLPRNYIKPPHNVLSKGHKRCINKRRVVRQPSWSQSNTYLFLNSKFENL